MLKLIVCPHSKKNIISKLSASVNYLAVDSSKIIPWNLDQIIQKNIFACFQFYVALKSLLIP